MRAAGPVKAIKYDLTTGASAWALLRCSPDAAPVRLREPSAFLSALVPDGAPANTQKARAHDLALWFGWLEATGQDWRRADAEVMSDFVTQLKTVPKGYELNSPVRLLRVDERGRAPSSLKRAISSIKTFYLWAVDRDLVSERAAGQISRFRGPRVPRSKTAHRLSANEVNALFAAVAHQPREMAFFELLYSCALRIGEGLGLCFEDVHLALDNRALGCAYRGAHVHIVPRDGLPAGVEHKPVDPRIVPMTPRAVQRYREWLATRVDALGVDDPSRFVFVSLTGRHRGAAWTMAAALKRSQRLARQLGFPFSPHVLRHTCATEMFEAGVARDVLQAFLGHVSPESTAVYLHPHGGLLVDAVEKLAAYRRQVGS